MNNVVTKSILTAGAIMAGYIGLGEAVAAPQRTFINLTQTACQFLEPENGVDHGYSSTNSDDCKAINAKTGAERLAKARELHLKPGKYVFRVTNRNVPYELGFVLRGTGLGRVSLPSAAGGGLGQGTTKDFAVELKEGEYQYFCPLNPTLNYRLVVSS